jgi:succinoglycan biosynthesis transport protein ExoP
MNNMEENTKRNGRSAEDNHEHTPESPAQSKDNSSSPREEAMPAEIIAGTRKRIPAADATLLPAQFMAAPGAAQAIPSVGDIIKSMLRFKWTILVVFILIAAPAIAAIWTQIVPKYRAQAEVRVRPIIPYLVFKSEDSGAIPLYDSFVNTQVSIIQNTTVLQRVQEHPVVRQTQWYQNPPKSLLNRLTGNMPTALDRLRDNLSVRPRRGTELIDVTFTDSNATDAQIITNTILDQYKIYITERSDETQDKLSRQLEDEYTRLGNDISLQEKSAAELRKKLRTASPEELISGMRIRLDQAQARLDQLQLDINQLEWEKKRIDANESNNISASAADKLKEKPKYYEDEEWRRLDNNVRIIRHNIDTSLLTPNNPDANKAKKELQFAQEQLKLREQQLDEQWQDRLNNPAAASITIEGAKGMTYEEGLIYLEHRLAGLKHEKQLLAEKYNQEKANFDELFQTAESFTKENNDLQHTRELFNAVRQRLDQKNMEKNVPVSIEVQTRAIVPTKPYNDRRAALTLMALIMALGSGGGLAYLRASNTQAIYTPKDMPLPMQVPFLGYIPMARNLSSPPSQAEPATVESVRILRTSLLSRLNGYGGATVLVTSAAEGTGKSTFTMMLGESLARSGKKVLLIDADFRKKTLTKQFDLSDKAGLIQSLNQGSSAKHYIYKTEEIPGLSFMPAGTQSNNGTPFEETANGDFKLHIDKLRSKYSIILLDSPPVLPVADAAILSGQVDGTIIVEQELVSRRTDVINALIRLNSAGGRFLGTVFIGSDSQGKYG